jgi:cell division protein FtsB
MTELRRPSNMAKVRNIKKSKSKQLKGKIAALLIVVALIVAWMAPATIKMMSAKRENALLKKELSQIERENKGLKKLIKKLHTNEYVELEARKQLGYIKKGEKAYIVIPKNVKVKKKKLPKKSSWWDNMLKGFSKLF